jgi:hypothetical protein
MSIITQSLSKNNWTGTLIRESPPRPSDSDQHRAVSRHIRCELVGERAEFALLPEIADGLGASYT